MLMKAICRSRPALPYGTAGSCLADHTEAVHPQLYSGCMARQGQENRTLCKAPQFPRPSLAPLYTDTPGELGH